MSSLHVLGSVLSRCKIPESVPLVVGTPKQMEIVNTRAYERIKGMINQESNSDAKLAMQVEILFIKARQRYLKTGKIKRSLLNRAAYIARSNWKDKDAIAYVEKRRDLFIASAENNEEKKEKNLEEIREIFISQTAAVQRVFGMVKKQNEHIEYRYKGIDLVFSSKAVYDLFMQNDYKSVVKMLRNDKNFESVLIHALAKVELFMKNLRILVNNSNRTSAKTLRRYVTQWPSLYQETETLFAENFINMEYLMSLKKEVPKFEQECSIPLHPITYDISSRYLQSINKINEEEQILQERLQDMAIERK